MKKFMIEYECIIGSCNALIEAESEQEAREKLKNRGNVKKIIKVKEVE